jgi:hypothetical protein
LDPIQEEKRSRPDVGSSNGPLLCLFLGWGVGAVGFGLAVQSGFLPTATRIGVTELFGGAVLYGLFVGLTAAQVAQAAVRERKTPWLVLVGMLLGMSLGAAMGYAIVQEFFGAVWTGLGGALAGGFVGTQLSSRTRSCT